MANSPILLHEHNEYIDVGVFLEVSHFFFLVLFNFVLFYLFADRKKQGIDIFENFLKKLAFVDKLPKEHNESSS